MKALSIRQPWAWLILNAGKDIENRSWRNRFRGRVLIHASKGMSIDEYDSAVEFVRSRVGEGIIIPPWETLDRGGIIGEAEIVDCVSDSRSPWFVGPYGFMLRNPKTLPFSACRGSLAFFEPPVSPDLYRRRLPGDR